MGLAWKFRLLVPRNAASRVPLFGGGQERSTAGVDSEPLVENEGCGEAASLYIRAGGRDGCCGSEQAGAPGVKRSPTSQRLAMTYAEELAGNFRTRDTGSPLRLQKERDGWRAGAAAGGFKYVSSLSCLHRTIAPPHHRQARFADKGSPLRVAACSRVGVEIWPAVMSGLASDQASKRREAAPGALAHAAAPAHLTPGAPSHPHTTSTTASQPSMASGTLAAVSPPHFWLWCAARDAAAPAGQLPDSALAAHALSRANFGRSAGEPVSKLCPRPGLRPASQNHGRLSSLLRGSSRNGLRRCFTCPPAVAIQIYIRSSSAVLTATTTIRLPGFSSAIVSPFVNSPRVSLIDRSNPLRLPLFLLPAPSTYFGQLGPVPT